MFIMKSPTIYTVVQISIHTEWDELKLLLSTCGQPLHYRGNHFSRFPPQKKQKNYTGYTLELKM